MPATFIDNSDQIVITASRAPETEAQTAASVSVIDQQRIERLGEPQVAALLRLTPSAAVATSGPAGSLTEVRIRGAEANHSLLFVDGIKINDPASGDAPRFELLNADLASRVEVVRGPQSALWGSEAIGGVIAINGLEDAAGKSATVETGSFGFLRASASVSLASSDADLGGAVGFQRATGIDSFNGKGDKDGYHNVSGRVRAAWHPSANVEVGASVLALTGRSDFDGFDPVTFAHTDTLDNSRNRLGAARIWASLGSNNSPWKGQVAASILGSSNRNFLVDVEQNRTRGGRDNVSAQIERRFTTGGVNHRLIAAADLEHESFHARDTIYGGLSDQDRDRVHEALTVEWRAETKAITGDLAVRRDMFNRFKDATSMRASLLASLGHGFSLTGSYGEGISQPTFFDLYGFFPNNFLGNPSLKPESSRGFEASIRYRKGSIEAALTGYQQRLHDEIIDIFDPATGLLSTANSNKVSHRSGIEASLSWTVSEKLRFSSNYAYLKATQPDDATQMQVHELRRPKHSGSVALDGKLGKFTYGGSIAYVGRHLDQRDNFPFDRVTLGSYWLADARIGYSIAPGIDAFGRMSNALGQHYEDVFGYRTEPRAVYAGLRFSAR